MDDVQTVAEKTADAIASAITAKQVKEDMVRYLLFRRSMKALAHEHNTGLSICDMFAVTPNLFSIEYEIKVDRADLAAELKIIKMLLTQDLPLKCSFSKRWKHETYLRRADDQRNFIPNQFYFAVTPELADLALAGVEGTPYGVIVREVNGEMAVKKTARKLHHRRMLSGDLADLCRKLCWVAYNAITDPYSRTIK